MSNNIPKNDEELELFIDKISEIGGYNYKASTSNVDIVKEIFEVECYSKTCKDFTFTEVAHYGGEGQGEDLWVVYKVLENDTKEFFYVKFYGYYTSWDGSEWQGYGITEPSEQTIIVWL